MKLSRALPLIILLAGCSNGTEPVIEANLAVVTVATGLSSPVFLTAPAGDARLFIVEQTGAIRIVKNGQLLQTPYLNIASKVSCCSERGLLGLAFHPNFATNGYFYVNYTDGSGNTVVERYTATPTADVANANSGATVITFAQPYANHNGGMLAFGPDGMLWIGTGDGGSAGDPQNHAQRLNTVLGKMLRIDVNGTAINGMYSIPSNNPFAGSTTNQREIWSWGLRNPWRYSFDRQTGDLYVADVGQGSWEEVTVTQSTRASVNYGWKVMEGAHCYNAATCTMTGLEMPTVEYDHSNGRCSITGGYVYRGIAIPGVHGHYFYSDYCAGFLRSFRWTGSGAAEQVEWDVGTLGNVSSFGEDAAGELYILSHGGTVYRIVSG